MARVKLDLPAVFPFSTELTVRITEINYGRHLANDSLLGLLHEARIRFLKQHGLSEEDVDGVSMIMTDAVIVYENQAFHGDRLHIDVAVAAAGKCACDFYFRVIEPGRDAEIGRAKTGIAFFDYRKQKICRMPECFKNLLAPAPEGEIA